MMGKVTLRNLAAHKIRLVLTAVAVILGVAFVAGTLIFTDSMNKQFDDLFSRIGTNVAVDVRAKKVIEGDDDGMAAQPVPATVLKTLQGIDGVKDPKGNVNGYAAVVGKDGKIVGTAQDGPPQIGTNWATGGTYDLASGRAPQGPDEVVIDAKTAEKGKLAVGDTTRVITAGPPARMRIVGLVDAGNLMGATLTGFDTPTAQRLMLKPGYFSDIEMGSTGPSQSELRDRVAKALPQNLEAVTGEKLREESKSDIAAMMSFFRTFLLVFALISIFVGSFIIFNTFSMLVAQRTRELALLRAIGAARGQVTRAVIAALPRVADTPPPPDLSALTDRERQVLAGLGAGLSNIQIGTRLRIGEATVKTHVSRVLSKLGVQSRVQAAVIASQSGLDLP